MANARFKNETILRTERLRIRPLQKDDAQFIWDMRQHRKIYQWTMSGQWLDRKVADNWVTNAIDTENNYNFIVELPSPTGESNTANAPASVDIGSIGLFGDAELGYLIHPEYWGRGYATEAIKAFLDGLWEGVRDVEKVTGFVDSENVGSVRVLEKCGFREGRREKYENKTLGEREEVVFEIQRPEGKKAGTDAEEEKMVER